MQRITSLLTINKPVLKNLKLYLFFACVVAESSLVGSMPKEKTPSSAQSVQELLTHDDNQSITIKQSCLVACHTLGNVSLIYNKDGFHVQKEGELIPIQRGLMDADLRELNCAQVIAFQKHGYFILKQLGEDEYMLHARMRGN